MPINNPIADDVTIPVIHPTFNNPSSIATQDIIAKLITWDFIVYSLIF